MTTNPVVTVYNPFRLLQVAPLGKPSV